MEDLQAKSLVLLILKHFSTKSTEQQENAMVFRTRLAQVDIASQPLESYVRFSRCKFIVSIRGRRLMNKKMSGSTSCLTCASWGPIALGFFLGVWNWRKRYGMLR